MVDAKKPRETDKKQSARFKKLAEELEAAGELDLTEAEEKFEELVDRISAGAKSRKHPD